jgi:hypothetical protein
MMKKRKAQPERAKVTTTKPEGVSRLSQMISTGMARIGFSPRSRLAWAVRAVQRPRKELTPGDWDNLRLELLGFIWPGNMPESAAHGPPSKEDAQEAVNRMGGIIEAAIKRQSVILSNIKDAVRVLRWDPETFIYRVVWGGQADLTWGDAAAEQLGRLLERVGSLLKECPAPAVRGREGETCGTWFVAKRPNQDYCSGTCQSRASTRAKRAGTPTPAALKRREEKKEG